MAAEDPYLKDVLVLLLAVLIFVPLFHRVRISTVLAYLVAGMVISPFTPGFITDETLAPQLAEIGVILLMFGVGLHFSMRDLLSVRAVAVPGAILHHTTMSYDINADKMMEVLRVGKVKLADR